ncbi:MAG: PAS domain S-box protein, partial [Candidatus Eremiobacteraeota bacterium]|nr:PAS domain S-box protein [Candidatus Eremiobacteraeota bacterium]
MKELFRVLAESSMAGVCLIQEDRFQYANPAMTRMFGHTLEALRAGISPVDLVPAADRTAFAASVLRPLAGEGKEVRCRFRGLRKDGSSFPAELLARKVQWDGGAGLAAT